MSLRTVLLDSPGQMSQVLGDGATFQNLTGNTLTLDSLNVHTLRAQEIITGNEVLPSVFFYGMTPWPTIVASSTGVKLPAPVYYFAPTYAGTAGVLDPLNPYFSATLIEGGQPTTVLTGGPGFQGTDLALVNLQLANSQYASGGTRNNQIDTISVVLTTPTVTVTPAIPGTTTVISTPATTNTYVCWYVIGAPPQSTPSSWGGNVDNDPPPFTVVGATTRLPATTGHYTSSTLTTGGAIGAADINNWSATAPTLTSSTLHYMPYTITPAVSQSSSTFNPAGSPGSPADWVGATPGSGQKLWPPMPGATTVVNATTQHPGFWVQQAVLRTYLTGSGATTRYRYSNVTNTLQGKEPTVDGQGVRYQVYNRVGGGGNETQSLFSLDMLVGNTVGTTNMEQATPVPGTNPVQQVFPQLLLTLGCCSSSFANASIRWSAGSSVQGTNVSLYLQPYTGTSPNALVAPIKTS
jgi:hypothetical protein